MKKAYLGAALSALSVLLGASQVMAQANTGSETTSRQPVLTKPPTVVHFEEAPYPESEKASQRPASVILQISISDTGIVESVVVVQSAGKAFDEAALAATRKFLFSPAELDHKPAPVTITYRYDFVFKEEPKGPQVNFEGVVKNQFTNQPMKGVVVTLDGGKSVTTDEQGHFQFEDVPEGQHSVKLESSEISETMTTEEAVATGRKTSVQYALEPKQDSSEAEEYQVDEELEFTASKLQKEVVSTAIATEEGRRVPGTAGDTLKVVQNLPGVARASFGSGQLVVWGAAPQDTRVYVDGVRVPQLYHGGGLRSIFSSDLVSSISLAPGGYGSAYGRGLGGLVTVDTRALRSDGFHGFVAADVIDASAMVETPINDSTRVALAGRKGYLSNVLSAVTDKDVNDFVPIPDYYDAQLKVQHEISKNESVEFMSLLSYDKLTRTQSNVDPAQEKSDRSVTAFGRVSARYLKQFNDGSKVSISPWAGLDHSETQTMFGGTPNVLKNDAKVFGLRAFWQGQVGSNVQATVGADTDFTFNNVHRQGSVTLPAREGDVTVFGQAPPEQVNTDDWSTVLGSVAPYGQLDISLFENKLRITPGLRIEPYITQASRMTPKVGDTPSLSTTSQTVAVDPRLALTYELHPRLSFKSAVGLYHQSPSATDLSAVFGTPTAGISRAAHVLGGFNFKLTEKLSIEEVVFYSKSDGLLTRSLSSTPSLAELLVQEGEGRSYGIQFMARHELTKGFFGWISYTLMRAERKDHPSTDWRLFDYDQTHVATAVASYEFWDGYQIGLRLRYSTGYPRTAVTGSYRSLRRDLYEPIFGEQNGIRIPAFMQADIRASKSFKWSWAKAEFYVDVQNVTDRANPEEMVYNYDYSKRQYITGFPILPVVGGRLEW